MPTGPRKPQGSLVSLEMRSSVAGLTHSQPIRFFNLAGLSVRSPRTRPTTRPWSVSNKIVLMSFLGDIWKNAVTSSTDFFSGVKTSSISSSNVGLSFGVEEHDSLDSAFSKLDA